MPDDDKFWWMRIDLFDGDNESIETEQKGPIKFSKPDHIELVEESMIMSIDG